MVKTYCLYMHENKLNEKKYIGISIDPKKRWGKNGINYKKQQKFYYAIEKYGWNNFYHKILLKNLNYEEALEKEIEYIKKYNSISNGYNVSEGGNKIINEIYLVKKYKDISLTITSLKSGKTKEYENIKDASIKTGINEKWFYKAFKYKTLDGFEIRFLNSTNENKENYSEDFKKIAAKSWKKLSLEEIEILKKHKKYEFDRFCHKI